MMVALFLLLMLAVSVRTVSFGLFIAVPDAAHRAAGRDRRAAARASGRWPGCAPLYTVIGGLLALAGCYAAVAELGAGAAAPGGQPTPSPRMGAMPRR